MFRVLLFTVLAGLAALVFQNCSEGATFTQISKTSVEDPAINEEFSGDQDDDIGVINEACDTLSPQTRTINVQFPKPQNECAWNQNGNLGRRNAVFRARIEQRKSLGLPAGAVICDAQFDFDPQPYQYDDYFALLFNQNVITSGYDFRSYLEAKNFGLLEYNWTNIRDIPMNFGSAREQVFCPQIPNATAQCDFPGHDTQGTIRLSLDKRYIRAVMSNGVPADHSFTLVTFGDDNDLDCEHSDVEFDVSVTYVVTE